MTRLATIVLAAVASVGCSTFSIRADRCPALPSVSTGNDVKIQYLGVGGYLVQRGDDVVLFGPVYSNPTLLEAMGDHQIRTDGATVDRFLPTAASQAKAIVIGHSHYDHLLDTPYIANKHATGATVYGSTTTASIIASELPSSRIVDVNKTPVPQGGLQIGIRMRLTPIKSEHADQFRVKVPLIGTNIPFHVWRGEIPKPLSALPPTSSGWAEGEVFSYLLDFLDANGKVEFRIYYQDSGTDEPVGYPWPRGQRPADQKEIDVSLICLGGDFEALEQHPEGIIAATAPRFLILGHWENFFVPQTDICRTNRVRAIPLQATDMFVARASAAMKDANVKGKPIVPCPTASVFHFPVSAAGDSDAHKKLKDSRATFDCARR